MSKLGCDNSFWHIHDIFFSLRMRDLFESILSQNEPMELIIPDVKRKSVAMIQILFGVNMTIYKKTVAPGSEITFFSQPPPILL